MIADKPIQHGNGIIIPRQWKVRLYRRHQLAPCLGAYRVDLLVHGGARSNWNLGCFCAWFITGCDA